MTEVGVEGMLKEESRKGRRKKKKTGKKPWRALDKELFVKNYRTVTLKMEKNNLIGNVLKYTE